MGPVGDESPFEEEVGQVTAAVTCPPRMTVFPVGAEHNIGYDNRSCGSGTCEISCPDRNANSDWMSRDHQGIDVFAFRGAPLVAVADGTIVRVGTPSSTSGIRVRLSDDCGWEYYYGHMDSVSVVQGQRVSAGDVLGTMGNTGTGGVHLHFNISPDGEYNNDINPFALLESTSGTACSQPRFGAEYANQTFPFAAQDFILAPGEERAGYIEMRNTGTETWRPGETFLATTEPRAVDSALAADDWIGPTRPASIDRVVEPGQTGRFEFTVRAPSRMGDYPQFFGLVQEGVAWFSDAGEGGPPDNLLQIRVTVQMDGPPDAGSDAGSDADAGAMDAGTTDAGIMDAGMSGMMDATQPDAGTADGGTICPDSGCDEGCSCVIAGSKRPPPLALFAFIALAAWRRRVRR
jgi:MYXO-CTERM domain-containing protein